MDYIVRLKDHLGNYLIPVAQATIWKADQVCYDSFVSKMNEKALAIGMTNTTFINPSGLGESGNYSRSTARDLAKLCVECANCVELCRVWNKYSHAVKVKGKSTIDVTTSVQSTALTNYYPILGGKTGAGDGYRALIVLSQVNGVQVACAIMGTSSDTNRFSAMKQLLDAVKVKLEGGTPSSSAVSLAESACAFRVPMNSSSYKNTANLEVLYEKNADVQKPPMSTTKAMTALLALEYIKDIHQSMEIKAFDLINTSGTSGAIFTSGDVVTLEDLFYAAMLPSSNQAANAIARFAGNIIKRADDFEW